MAKDFGFPVESVLLSSGLPGQLPEASDSFLLERNCWAFIHAISKKEFCCLYGLIAAERIPWVENPTLKPFFKDCLSLYELLNRVVSFSYTQNSASVFALIEEGDFIWFVNQDKPLLPKKESIQIELFNLSGMIQFVQACTGKDWRPDEIHLTITQTHEVKNASQLNPSRLFFSKPFLKIKIPRKLLFLPIADSVLANCDGAGDIHSIEPFPNIPVKQLILSISPYLESGNVSKPIIAKALNMSGRTLQRCLQQHSTCYSKIIDQVRYEKGKGLLINSDLSIIEISLMLGYKNASSYTRSFRRLSGLSPKEYRYYNAKK